MVNAHAILGVTPEAGEEAIRAAYLRKVKEHPPEKSPQEFEKIRDAYDMLRDPRRRAKEMLMVDPRVSLESLAAGLSPQRRFTGPQAWLEVLKKK